MLWTSSIEQGFAAPIWMAFKHAIELSAYVRKGEKGSLVVYANRTTKTEDDGSGNEVEREIPFMKGYTVFNVDQIEGLPEIYYTACSTGKMMKPRGNGRSFRTSRWAANGRRKGGCGVSVHDRAAAFLKWRADLTRDSMVC